MAGVNKKKLLIGLIVVVVLAVVVVSNLKRKSGDTKTVQTEVVKYDKIIATVSGSAKIKPEVQVKISAEVSGKIVNLGVKEGDYVHKGDFLVQLNPQAYKAAVEQSQSNLSFARAGFEKARNEFERSQELFKNNLISKSELEIAKSTYEQSKAQVDQSSAALKQAKENLAKTIIYSPMEGTVSRLNKKVGEMAMGSQFTLDVIMEVSDLTRMLAETEIDENDIIHVSLGDTAKVMVDAYPDTSFKGVVTEISNSGTTAGLGTQEEVTNFTVKALLLEKPEKIRPGMSATVDVITDKRDKALVISIQCVTVRKPVDREKKELGKNKKSEEIKDTKSKDKKIRVVFVVHDGIARQTEVKTGISSDTHWEVLKGLKEGDVVVSGSYRVISKDLEDGDKVKVDNSLKKYQSEKKS
ncbi:efflux RND transporter periplasmic adaptor subunit [bacterium]|nr:efflux RND transporter periplasmic adaptor subunit [bacterium]